MFPSWLFQVTVNLFFLKNTFRTSDPSPLTLPDQYALYVSELSSAYFTVSFGTLSAVVTDTSVSVLALRVSSLDVAVAGYVPSSFI